MTADLAEACAALAALLPVAQALTAEPDVEDGTDAMPGVPSPFSRPPWNPAAANAWLDAHAGVRDIELTLRIEAGLPARHRGGSDACTLTAIAAIEVLSSADVSDAAIAKAVRDLDRLTRPIEQLPAVDKAEPWRKVEGVACPYCGLPMLYVRPRSLQVTCLRGPCRDSEGRHPIGHMEISRLTADPIVRWNDGLVAP